METFSRAVRVGTRLNCWKMNPTLRARNAVSSRSGIEEMVLPKRSIVPESARKVPHITLSSVVLPQPDGPTIMSNSPKVASRLTPLRARTAISPLP